MGLPGPCCLCPRLPAPARLAGRLLPVRPARGASGPAPLALPLAAAGAAALWGKKSVAAKFADSLLFCVACGRELATDRATIY